MHLYGICGSKTAAQKSMIFLCCAVFRIRIRLYQFHFRNPDPDPFHIKQKITKIVENFNNKKTSRITKTSYTYVLQKYQTFVYRTSHFTEKYIFDKKQYFLDFRIQIQIIMKRIRTSGFVSLLMMYIREG